MFLARRQRTNALAYCLGVRGFTRLLIGESLALRAAKQFLGLLTVGNLAVIVFEIELGEIAIQMGLAHVIERSHHAALEKGEIGLDGIRVPEIAAHIFVDAVVDGDVAGELATRFDVDPGFVGHEV